MKRHCQNINRKHAFKRQSSQESKKLKGKKSESISPIRKQIYVNGLHQNKENFNPITHNKQQSPFQQSKSIYFQMKNQSLEKQIHKQKLNHPSIHQIQKPKQVYNVVSKSLQKCQFYHKKQTPKSSYLIESKNQEFLCCEECSKKYAQRRNVRKTVQTQIAGRKVCEYFKILQENLNKMLVLRENTIKYESKYKEYALMEEKKHRSYYFQLIQVIEETMKKSQTIIRKKINQVQNIFDEKIYFLDEDITKLKNMIKNLLNLKDDFYDLKELNRLCNLEECHILEVPFLSFNINDELVKDFKANFIDKFQIKAISQRQILKPKIEEKKKIDLYSQYYYRNGSEYYEKKQYPRSRIRYQQVQHSSTFHDDTQLYCDEALSSVKQFSVDCECEKEILTGIVPIIELTEEEDVISPVFKEL